MSRLKYSIYVLLLLATTASAQDWDKIQVEIIPLSGNVQALVTRAGGNQAICVGEDGIFLVDSGYRELGEKVTAALAEISDQPVKYVFNTHWHFDHTGGNEHLHAGGAAIVAHENIRKRMAAGQLITIIDAEVEPSPPAALPMITYTDKVNFHLNGQDIECIHMPGAHTDGDGVVIFHQANVVHMGDIVFNLGYPFCDISSGGNINGMIAAIEKTLEFCDDETQIIPGHGPLLDTAGLAEYGGMLEQFRDIIVAEIAAGKDLDTIREDAPTAEIDEKWNRQFPAGMFTEMVYLSLKQD